MINRFWASHSQSQAPSLKMTSLQRSCFHQFTRSTKYLLAISCALAEGHKWKAGYQDPPSRVLDECGKHQGREGYSFLMALPEFSPEPKVEGIPRRGLAPDIWWATRSQGTWSKEGVNTSSITELLGNLEPSGNLVVWGPHMPLGACTHPSPVITRGPQGSNPTPLFTANPSCRVCQLPSNPW